MIFIQHLRTHKTDFPNQINEHGYHPTVSLLSFLSFPFSHESKSIRTFWLLIEDKIWRQFQRNCVILVFINFMSIINCTIKNTSMWFTELGIWLTLVGFAFVHSRLLTWSTVMNIADFYAIPVAFIKNQLCKLSSAKQEKHSLTCLLEKSPINAWYKKVSLAFCTKKLIFSGYILHVFVMKRIRTI